MTEIVAAIYDLMGRVVDPMIEDEAVREKVEKLFQVTIFSFKNYHNRLKVSMEKTGKILWGMALPSIYFFGLSISSKGFTEFSIESFHFTSALAARRHAASR